MKYWDSVRKQTDYYDQYYGHIFHPVASFDELLSMFEKVGKINPEDKFETLNTWKLLEDYENKFIFSCKPRNEGMLISYIIMKYVAGKVLKERCDDRHAVYEIPKVIAPKEKIEVVETPEVKTEEMNIFISDIFIPPDYPRRRVDPNRVNKIALSMKKIGQVDPISVVPMEYAKDIEKIYGTEVKKKYKYILIRGRHRIEAKKLLNNFYIRARVIHNDYVEERMKSSVENTLLKKGSVYEQSLDFNVLLKLGKTEKEVAEKWEVDRSYVNKIKDFAKFKDDFGEKDYVLTILNYEALEKLYWIKISKDIRKYDFVKEKIIKAYESGVRKIRQKHIFKWCDEYEEIIKGKEKEIQRKLYGKETPTIQIQKSIESQQVQLQVQKPISRIPKQEEVKEKEEEYKKKLKEKRKKEKTPEEKFNKKIESYKYFYGEEFDSMNAILIKYMKDHDIPFERVQKLQAYYRECNREAWEFSQEKLSKEEKEELNKRFYNIADKFFKGELK
jgi:hypothetical protein